jgi:MoaA/NifB/PqqE/SkfB family radical SAM enzyme
MGDDMPRDVVVQALKLARDTGEYTITIGGGEPTLHKNFWDYVGLALGHSDIESPLHIATNGTVEKTALKLADLAKAGILHVELSRTEWHRAERVQPTAAVLKAFERKKRSSFDRDNDMRGVREETGAYGVPFAVGRASEWGTSGCCCDTIHVDPNGDLYECGCRLKQIGTVFKPEIPEGYFEREDRCTKVQNADAGEVMAQAA